MNKLFDYIEKRVKEDNVCTLDLWGTEERSKMYSELNKLYDSENPMYKYGGKTYLVTSHAAKAGRGGMDEGTPHTYKIKLVGKVNLIKDDRPTPVANPDFSGLISNLENEMERVARGEWFDDADANAYAWEEAMKAVYGKDVFDWWNKNVNH